MRFRLPGRLKKRRVAEGRDYAVKIARAKLVIVPECGHAPSIEKPAAFLAAVESFAR